MEEDFKVIDNYLMVKMPEEVNNGYENPVRPCDPVGMLRSGKMDRGAVRNSVRRILKLMERLD